MKLAVIPARGGSQRIPRKNIKSFCGKPMIAWSIEAALESDCFDHVVVSTEDDEIAEIARHYGASVPFLRPAELADHVTGTIPVVAHTIEWFRENRQMPLDVCCVYATAPFVKATDVAHGLKMLKSSACDYVFAVTSYSYPIQRAIRVGAQGRVEMLHPELFDSRSQELEETFHDAGQFYWGRANAWLAEKTIFGPDALAMQLPRYRVQDIDTIEDWTRAEYLFRILNDETHTGQKELTDDIQD